MPNHRYKMLDGFPHFMTCTIVDWLPVFRQDSCARIVLDSLAHLQSTGELELYAYVVMPDHVHLVADGPDLPSAMQKFSSFTAREIVQETRSLGLDDHLDVFRVHCTDRRRSNTHKIWRTGSHPQVLYSPAVLNQKINYIRQNPVRAGLVETPEDWPYSSFATTHAGP